jgi:hypothetical protein
MAPRKLLDPPRRKISGPPKSDCYFPRYFRYFFSSFSERNFSRLRRTFTGLSPLCVCYFLLFCDLANRGARFLLQRLTATANRLVLAADERPL